MRVWTPARVAIACGMFMAGSASGSLIDFDFSGVSGLVAHDPDTFELTAVDDQDPHLSLVAGVNLFNPSVLVPVTAGGAATDDLNVNQFGTSTSTSILAAINGFRYLSFTIQAAPGWQLSLNNATVSFSVRRNGANAPQRYGIAVETGGGTFEAADQIGSNVEISDTVVHIVAATFPSSGFAGLTGPVEVRLYGWNAAATSGNSHISDASITGGELTVIPEPATAGVLILGALLLGAPALRTGTRHA